MNREDFPILQQTIHGHPLVYIDNAATTQKPHSVVQRITNYYEFENANVHRGVYYLCEKATLAYEEARQSVADYIHAASAKECIFVRGTTEAINLVANGLLTLGLKSTDEILISQLEHHSNIVPWQGICEQTGATLQVIPCNELGELDLEAYQRLLNSHTKLVAIAHIANSIGTLNPIKEMIDLAHANGTPVLIDGAQAVAHLAIDVTFLDCDFYAFSAHKIYGPTGIGVLYGKSAWLERLPPYQRGGDMISSVSFAKTTFQEPPYKFEAGTPAIAPVLGLKAAIDYINSVGLERITKYEDELLLYASDKLQLIPGLTIIGQANDKGPIIAFTLADIHPHDIATALDRSGIAIRSGQLCAQPAIESFGIKAVARASFALYNTFEEIDRLAIALNDTVKLFGV
jgi:cysteine desulfurase/selenocysteine lyase